MSGPARDLFGAPNEAACPTCHTIKKNFTKARERHEREERRQKARAFARTGVSQRVRRGEA